MCEQQKNILPALAKNKTNKQTNKTNAILKGVLPIMAYMGRVHLKGVPFSGFRYVKG